MTDLSVRETAARAYTEHLIGWAMADDEWEAARSSTEVAAMGVALAAVAAHDGLAEALRTHGPYHTAVVGDDLWCATCDRIIGHADHREDHHAAHLADVVRAWLLT